MQCVCNRDSHGVCMKRGVYTRVCQLSAVAGWCHAVAFNTAKESLAPNCRDYSTMPMKSILTQLEEQGEVAFSRTGGRKGGGRWRLWWEMTVFCFSHILSLHLTVLQKRGMHINFASSYRSAGFLTSTHTVYVLDAVAAQPFLGSALTQSLVSL